MKLFVALVVAGVLGSQGPVTSQNSNPATHEHTRSDPWSGLFVVKPLPTAEGQPVTVLPLPPQANPARPQRHQPERGPCNMPILPANPDVDSKMIVPIPQEGTDARIRVIEPGVCGHANILGADHVRPPTSDKR